ncbi:RNA polymerase sigma factor [Aeromicrobium sp. UC242_57]|uniref:RNA polymerase sigma factor n=1 Tax=Aeromicrobium sp. UC242_57 TaxID=3374624 RepID=UPI0037ADFC39
MPNTHRADGCPAAPSLDELGDSELLRLARDGAQDAYAALFDRYSYPAYRLARHLGQRDESDDVVSEAFARVLALLRRGKGPETAFRAYLFTTIRHEAASRAKARQRVVPTDDVEQIDQAVRFGDGQLDVFERTTIRAAYESLPPRWRTVLWHVDVEGRGAVEIGPLLELSANSVSALVYRARSGLREAYLQQHVKRDAPVDGEQCRTVRSRLSAVVRQSAARRVIDTVAQHLETCEACRQVHAELVEVDRETVRTMGSAAAEAARHE